MTNELVDRRAAFENLAIDGDFLTRPYAQPVADHDRVERNFLVGAIVADASRGLWREIEKRLDGAGGLLARPQLQDLPEQDENGNDSRRFEIDRHRAIRASEGLRKDARRYSCDHAIDPGDACAHSDQREHVEMARDQRFGAAFEERPAGPQHNRRGEHELNPVRRLLADQPMEVEQVAAHFQGQYGDSQRQPDPEAPGHVDKLWILSRFRNDDIGLESHAADRASPWFELANLRVHRAGVDSAFRERRIGPCLLRHISRGVLDEFGSAHLRAEIVNAPGALGLIP